MANSSLGEVVVNATDGGEMTILGITFDPNSPAVLFEYSALNVTVNPAIPLPLAGSMTAAGALLFGLVSGIAINTASAVLGAWISLVGVRYACRPCLERRLGRYHSKWRALDAWALAFHSTHGRWPLVWFDRACIEANSAAAHATASIASLPLMVTGCKRLLCLAGPSYASRLWVLVEIVAFLWAQVHAFPSH